MPTTQEKSWRAGRFWWDANATTQSVVYPLRAVIFDLDALTDIECDGHRVAYNAAFAAHGLDIQWTVGRYRQLLALPDERQMVDLGREAATRGVSVRELERRVREAGGATRPKRAEPARESGREHRTAEVRRIEDRLRRQLQTDVTIALTERDRGEIRIAFYSNDDLERVMELMLGATGEAL